MKPDPFTEFNVAVRELGAALWTPLEELLTRVLGWLIR